VGKSVTRNYRERTRANRIDLQYVSVGAREEIMKHTFTGEK